MPTRGRKPIKTTVKSNKKPLVPTVTLPKDEKPLEDFEILNQVASDVDDFDFSGAEDFEDPETGFNYQTFADMLTPVQTFIPKEMAEKFEKLGMELRWVRIRSMGLEDRTNWLRRKRQGYTFVSPEEIKPFLSVMMVEPCGQFGDLIVAGDLALAKCPKELVKRRRELTQQVTRGLEETTAQKIREAGFKYRSQTTTQKVSMPKFSKSGDLDLS